MRNILTALGLLITSTTMAQAVTMEEIQAKNELCMTLPLEEVNACLEAVFVPTIWQVFHGKPSMIDDSPTVTILVDAQESYTGLWDAKITPHMGFACNEKRTAMVIDFQTFFMNDTTEVLYRLDSNPAQKVEMPTSNDNKAVIMMGRDAIDFFNTINGINRLVVRVTPFSGNTITSEFNIKGLAEAIKPVREACGW